MIKDFKKELVSILKDNNWGFIDTTKNNCVCMFNPQKVSKTTTLSQKVSNLAYKCVTDLIENTCIFDVDSSFVKSLCVDRHLVVDVLIVAVDNDGNSCLQGLGVSWTDNGRMFGARYQLREGKFVFTDMYENFYSIKPVSDPNADLMFCAGIEIDVNTNTIKAVYPPGELNKYSADGKIVRVHKGIDDITATNNLLKEYTQSGFECFAESYKEELGSNVYYMSVPETVTKTLLHRLSKTEKTQMYDLEESYERWGDIVERKDNKVVFLPAEKRIKDKFFEAGFDVSYDVTFDTHPSMWDCLTYTDFLGGNFVMVKPMCSTITRQQYADALVDTTNSTDYDYAKDILKLIDEGSFGKYKQGKRNPFLGKEAKQRTLVVLPGSNILKTVVAKDVIDDVVGSDAFGEVYIKPHPLTHDCDLEELKSFYGDKCKVLTSLENVYDYITHCETVLVPCSSEVYIVSLLLGKKVIDITHSTAQSTFSAIIDSIRFSDCPYTAFNKIVNSPKSGLFKVDNFDNGKLDKYVDYIKSLKNKCGVQY
jgi:hypothetical protein